MGSQRRGQAPYGFRWGGGELLQVPAEAETRRLMFALYAEHQRFAAVAAELKRLGRRTRQGKDWSPQQVGRLLSEASAVGRYRLGKGEGAQEVRCEPVVPESLWDQVQAIRDGGGAPRPTGGRPARFALAGLVYCSCGHALAAVSAKKLACSGCGHALPTGHIDGVVAELLRKFVASRTGSDAGGAAPGRALEWGVKLARVGQRLAEVDGEIDRLEQLALGRKISDGRFVQRHTILEAERDDLLAERGRLEKGRPPATPTDGGGSPSDHLERWLGLPAKTRHLIAAKLFDRLVVDVPRGEIVVCSPYEDLLLKTDRDPEQTKPRTNQLVEAALADAPPLIPMPPSGQKCPYTGLGRTSLYKLTTPGPHNGWEAPVKSMSIAVAGGGKNRPKRIFRDSLIDYLSSKSG